MLRATAVPGNPLAAADACAFARSAGIEDFLQWFDFMIAADSVYLEAVEERREKIGRK